MEFDIAVVTGLVEYGKPGCLSMKITTAATSH